MRKITIQIIQSAENGANSPSANNGANDKDSPKADVTDKKRIDAAQSIAHQITSNILTQVKSTGDYYVGRYYSMTEDYKGQNNSQNAMRVINLVAGTAASSASMGMASMTLLGSVLGPAAGAIGAAVGAVMSLTNEVIKTKNEYNEAMLAIQENAYSNYFYSERAGYADMGRGTND